MLKKIVLASVVALGSTTAFADRDAGCGIGSEVWAGQHGKLPKLLAATTNGIFLNQLFGITFGTLGCKGTGTVTAQVVNFTNENAEHLARDMAVGEGERLNVLAELLQIQAADKAHFFKVSQTNFAQIYAAENTTSMDILLALHEVMLEDDVLKAYV